MAYQSVVAGVAVLVPAMALVFLYLRRYEGYFDHNRLFFALLAGLFAGIVVRFLEVQLFPFENPAVLQQGGPPYAMGTILYSVTYTAFGFGLLESLGKTVVLGFGRFRVRKDTPYYGAALGIGFGAMVGTQLVAVQLQVIDGHFLLDATHVLFDALAYILALGLLLNHAASGVWVGRGSADGKLWRGSVLGALWLAPGLGIYWTFINSPLLGLPDVVFILAALLGLAWGVFALLLADRRILQQVVPPEIRDMVRKQRRRQRRA